MPGVARAIQVLRLNTQFDVIGIGGRRGRVAKPADRDEDQPHDQASDRGGEEHDAGHLEHPKDDVDADVFRRRRLLDDVDDDWFLL